MGSLGPSRRRLCPDWRALSDHDPVQAQPGRRPLGPVRHPSGPIRWRVDHEDAQMSRLTNRAQMPPADPADNAAARTVGSRPSSAPNAIASSPSPIVAVTIVLLTSFASCPLPTGPKCNNGSPTALRAGRHCATAAASPPTSMSTFGSAAPTLTQRRSGDLRPRPPPERDAGMLPGRWCCEYSPRPPG